MKYDLTESERLWAKETWEQIQKKINTQCKRIGSIMPYISVNGSYQDMGVENLEWWTNGFWGGILWQMYHATGESCYMDTAAALETRLDAALENYVKLDHDVGFMWLHTGVADYRLTQNETARRRGLHAAGILAGRFNSAGNYICAWNGDRPGIAIVDCLMNLPLLYWASEELHDPRFRVIAERHSDMALHYILRPDGSCNHLVEFDPVTGEYKSALGGQGYGDGSSWSRGQAWAIYGMALAFRYTGKEEYLDAAKRTAHYFCANAALQDYLPFLDFRAPESPVYYDTTAGLCAACGLLELSELVGEYERVLYVKSAIRMMHAITGQFCNWNPEQDGIVSHGSAKYHRERDREVPIIYGDYFLIEGILRLLGQDFMIW